MAACYTHGAGGTAIRSLVGNTDVSGSISGRRHTTDIWACRMLTNQETYHGRSAKRVSHESLDLLKIKRMAKLLCTANNATQC